MFHCFAHVIIFASSEKDSGAALALIKGLAEVREVIMKQTEEEGVVWNEVQQYFMFVSEGREAIA